MSDDAIHHNAAYFHVPKDVPAALFTKPWVQAVNLDRSGMSLVLTRKTTEWEAYIVLKHRGIVWGLNYRPDFMTSPPHGAAVTLSEAYQKASEALEKALAGKAAV